jgi:NADPH-dependent 7-cyano-7-deazaguanine reductase QueF-like protein
MAEYKQVFKQIMDEMLGDTIAEDKTEIERIEIWKLRLLFIGALEETYELSMLNKNGSLDVSMNKSRARE